MDSHSSIASDTTDSSRVVVDTVVVVVDSFLGMSDLAMVYCLLWAIIISSLGLITKTHL